MHIFSQFWDVELTSGSGFARSQKAKWQRVGPFQSEAAAQTVEQLCRVLAGGGRGRWARAGAAELRDAKHNVSNGSRVVFLSW